MQNSDVLSLSRVSISLASIAVWLQWVDHQVRLASHTTHGTAIDRESCGFVFHHGSNYATGGQQEIAPVKVY